MHQQIAAAADDEILIWNSDHDEPVATLNLDDTFSVNFLTYSPCGSLLVTCAQDMIIWQCDTWTELHRLTDHRDDIMCAAFNASGEVLVSAAARKVQLWNVSSGEKLLSIQCKPSLMSAIFTVEGDMLVVGEQSDIVFFDCLTGDRLHSYGGHESDINSLCISPCTSNLLISGADSGDVFVWDMSSGEIQHRLIGHLNVVVHVSFNSDGSEAVSSSNDCTVRVWDVTVGSCLYVISNHLSTVYSACFSADDRYIISSSLDTTVKIWEIGTKEVIRTLRNNGSKMNFAACRPILQGSYI